MNESMVIMHSSILSISSVVPKYCLPQDEIADKMIHLFDLEEAKSETLRKLYANSLINKRYTVVPDFVKERAHWDFWGSDFPQTSPGMSKRNALYKKEAPLLAYEACLKALQSWGGDLQEITHIVSVSCTGVVAPGIEFHLVQKLQLSPSVCRLGVNFMGCFGAFKGLAVANAFATENPKHRVLLVCVELCSLHFQKDQDLETMVANSLFSDGASAVVIGAQPQPHERSLWQIKNFHSLGLENTQEKMSWEASDQGFMMRLSPQVPVIIKKHIQSFVSALLKTFASQEDCSWAVHPGGKAIVQAVEQALKLKSVQTKASWDTLADYGNMSSATLLFVLQRLLEAPLKRWTAAVGFGPGLSFEGLLLEAIEVS